MLLIIFSLVLLFFVLVVLNDFDFDCFYGLRGGHFGFGVIVIELGAQEVQAGEHDKGQVHKNAAHAGAVNNIDHGADTVSYTHLCPAWYSR